MCDFIINNNFRGIQYLEADDLLTAVKLSIKTKSDLYEDGNLIVSWAGLPMEENIARLLSHGIMASYKSGIYGFKWIDEAKNKERHFVHFHSYNLKGTKSLQAFVYDHPSSYSEMEFNSIQEVYSYILCNYKDIDESFISINVFNVEGLHEYKLREIKIAI